MSATIVTARAFSADSLLAAMRYHVKNQKRQNVKMARWLWIAKRINGLTRVLDRAFRYAIARCDANGRESVRHDDAFNEFYALFQKLPAPPSGEVPSSVTSKNTND